MSPRPPAGCDTVAYSAEMDVGEVGEKDEAKPRPPRAPPVFPYPGLSTAETFFNSLALAAFMIYAYYQLYVASYEYAAETKSTHALDLTNWPFINRRKDVSNWEWSNYTEVWLPAAFVCYLGHSIVLSLSRKFCGDGRFSSAVSAVYGMIAVTFVASPYFTLFVVIHGSLMLLFTIFMPHWSIPWSMGISVLYLYIHEPATISFFCNPYRDIPYYIELSVLTYTELRFISFCLTWVEETSWDKPESRGYLSAFVDFLEYAFYFPYIVSLVQTFRQFRAQRENRSQVEVTACSYLFLLKNVLYIFLFDFWRHFFYSDALAADISLLNRVRMDRLVIIGFSVGQFFHMKYVVLFGLPAAFGKLDGMTPDPGPICIAHVGLYTRIWRYFDRGLYQFLKEHIYLPIARPKFDALHKTIAGLVTFLFVIGWHGTTYSILVWIGINMVELVIEVASKGLYRRYMKEWRETHIGDRMFRRIVAWCQILPLTMCVYSVFFFLNGDTSGQTFVDRVFWAETVPISTWKVWLLYIYGYFFNQATIDIERFQENRRLKAKYD